MDKSMKDFKEWFNDTTGWEVSEYPNRESVTLMWDAWQAGRTQLLEDMCNDTD